MPQDLELVYEKETGMPAYMHSVDANEACLLGDYVRTPPKDVDDRDKAAAMAKARGMSAPVHPELLSPEARQQQRDEAMQVTMPQVAVPVGTPVVLQAGAVPEMPAREAGRAPQSRREEKK